MNIIILLLYICYGVVSSDVEIRKVGENGQEMKSGFEEMKSGFEETKSGFENGVDERLLSSVVHRTVNKYYCSVADLVPSHLIVYGTKAWSFPTQDVNLTLSYPTENTEEWRSESSEDQFMITGFKVVLYIDSDDSRGFITSGGLMQDTITLSFLVSNASSLSYEFWVYGVTERTHADDISEMHTLFVNFSRLCA